MSSIWECCFKGCHDYACTVVAVSILEILRTKIISSILTAALLFRTRVMILMAWFWKAEHCRLYFLNPEETILTIIIPFFARKFSSMMYTSSYNAWCCSCAPCCASWGSRSLVSRKLCSEFVNPAALSSFVACCFIVLDISLMWDLLVLVKLFDAWLLKLFFQLFMMIYKLLLDSYSCSFLDVRVYKKTFLISRCWRSYFSWCIQRS